VSAVGTTTEVLFDRSFTKPLVASFDQPHCSGDAGAVLLR